ncbi:YcaO-like family protein [Glycomyces dulcitolivorans]|uniref:YcaO-like family protein n=1 Tax=Glycomyces dulcitolivorans TaxID=2200759 RepID=UPI0018E54089|nr:YcaO-like family protein [Glycomyces dulcitolivorans]
MARLMTFPGTRRTRDPLDTLARIRPHLGEYGITRLADVTDLDVIGIPVVMSVRPLALTLSVSQGKGATLTHARVSAAMEAIELWHVEHAVPKAELEGVAAAELDLPYAVTALKQVDGGLLTDRTRLDWITAEILAGGETLVPRDAVQLGRSGTAWRGHHLSSSSNGLASGNTLAEATVHALYEQIERDSTAALALQPVGERDILDLDSVTDPHCADLIRLIRSAGGWLEVADASLEQWRPVKCFTASLWMPDMGTMFGGAGAHASPEIALSRAITEAAQSRLTFIAGTRDDLNPRGYLEEVVRAPDPVPPVTAWSDLTGGSDFADLTDDEELDRLVRLVTAATGIAPMRVDLTRPEAAEDFAVVKTLCPGLAFLARHDLPRPE